MHEIRRLKDGMYPQTSSLSRTRAKGLGITLQLSMFFGAVLLTSSKRAFSEWDLGSTMVGHVSCHARACAGNDHTAVSGRLSEGDEQDLHS